MKSSLWFDASMLALVLVAALAGALLDGHLRHHRIADSAVSASSQTQRLASGP